MRNPECRKTIVKYFLQILQILIFLILIASALYSVYYVSYHIGYPTVKDLLTTDLKGDLLVKGIPLVTVFLILISGLLFLIILYLHIYVCRVLLMIINGSVGDLIEYMNTPHQYEMPYYLVFREGGLGIILRNRRETRRRFLLRWRTAF